MAGFAKQFQGLTVNEYSPRRLDQHDYKETYYPNKFSPTFPGKSLIAVPSEPELLCHLPGEEKTFSVPISHLTHCTHNKNVGGIEVEVEVKEKFIFKARQKEPRPKSQKYNAGTKDSSAFVNGETVLPGYLSWWGISIVPWYGSSEGSDARILESKMRHGEVGDKSPIYLAPYLQYIDGRGSSVYGSNSYTFSLKKLIESYKESRKNVRGDRNVYLKKAGTLLYTYEISYVILVCLGKDLSDNPDICSMEGAGQPEEVDGQKYFHFQSNNFIDAEGKVNDDKIEEKKIFNSQYPIRVIYRKQKNGKSREEYNWDTLNFAFYYPDPGQLEVEAPACLRNRNVKHDSLSCHLKVKGGKCTD